jgi:excisionase family DNA binding protein
MPEEPRKWAWDDKPKAEFEPLIKAKAAADYLGLSVLTVRRMVVEGRLPAVVYTFGKKKLYRFKMSDLEKFVAAVTQNPSKEHMRDAAPLRAERPAGDRVPLKSRPRTR